MYIKRRKKGEKRSAASRFRRGIGRRFGTLACFPLAAKLVESLKKKEKQEGHTAMQ